MFESFKELFLSTANTAVNRAKNPVLGAFVMSGAPSTGNQFFIYFLANQT